MLNKICSVLLFSLATCSSCLAAIFGTTTAVTTFTAPDAALTGYTGYVVTVHSDAGELISALDVSLTGPLHQRWAIDPDTLEVFKTPSNGSLTNGDSHLTPLSDALLLELNEDNSGLGSPLPDTATRDYGLGTYLEGVWGIPGLSQSSSAAVAYVVVPNGQLQNVVATMGVAARTDLELSEPFFYSGPLAPLFNFTRPSDMTPPPGPGGNGISVGFDFSGDIPDDQSSSTLRLFMSKAGTGEITINSISFAGFEASNWAVAETLPTILIGGGPERVLTVNWTGPSQSAYSIPTQVLLNTSAGVFQLPIGHYIPEPASIALAGLGFVVLVGVTRRK